LPADGIKFKGDLTVRMFNVGKIGIEPPIQEIKIHTSCSIPIFIGQKFPVTVNNVSIDVIEITELGFFVPPPPSAADDTAKTKVNTPVTIKVLKNDWGVEHISSVETPTLNGGIVVTNPDGTLTYIPLPNFVGTDSFTYTVHYTEGGYGYADVTVTVTERQL